MSSVGINFRATSGYVSDGSGETYSLGAAYPETRAGFTFGWDSSRTSGTRDRSNSIDNRLAGIFFFSNTGLPRAKFRVDLPSTGAWNIRLALGDATSVQTQFVRLFDNATTFATISNVATSIGQFADANGSLFSAANWPANNVLLAHTFSSSIFFIELGDPASVAGNNTSIAHLYLETASGGGAGIVNLERARRGLARGINRGV